MNTDRFLTRVFDREKKEMLYPSKDGIAASQVYLDCHYRNTLIGVTNDSLIISRYAGVIHKVIYIPFGDRFIPMQCTGLKDKNKKLIFGGDIAFFTAVFGNLSAGIVNWCDREGTFYLGLSTGDGTHMLINSVSVKTLHVLGNKFETPDLLNN